MNNAEKSSRQHSGLQFFFSLLNPEIYTQTHSILAMVDIHGPMPFIDIQRQQHFCRKHFVAEPSWVHYFVDYGCTESYTPALHGFKQECTGTEKAKAIETQLGKFMQNKAEGPWSEHCTVANRGPESSLISMAWLVSRDVTSPASIWMKLVSCDCWTKPKNNEEIIDKR